MSRPGLPRQSQKAGAAEGTQREAVGRGEGGPGEEGEEEEGLGRDEEEEKGRQPCEGEGT